MVLKMGWGRVTSRTIWQEEQRWRRKYIICGRFFLLVFVVEGAAQRRRWRIRKQGGCAWLAPVIYVCMWILSVFVCGGVFACYSLHTKRTEVVPLWIQMDHLRRKCFVLCHKIVTWAPFLYRFFCLFYSLSLFGVRLCFRSRNHFCGLSFLWTGTSGEKATTAVYLWAPERNDDDGFCASKHREWFRFLNYSAALVTAMKATRKPNDKASEAHDNVYHFPSYSHREKNK